MNIQYEASFEKDLKKLRDKKLLQKISTVILNIKSSENLLELNNLKKLSGYDSFFSIRIGDYRIGFELSSDGVILTRILHRKEIYRYFP